MQVIIRIQWKGINTLNNFQYKVKKIFIGKRRGFIDSYVLFRAHEVQYNRPNSFPTVYAIFGFIWLENKLLLRIASIPSSLHCEY